MSVKVLRERTELLLMEYASGALDEACSMLVASYITLCPEARSYYRQCEQVGGTLIEQECKPVAMRKGSLEAVMMRLDETAPTKEIKEDCSFCQSQPLPSPIAQVINKSKKQANWKTFKRGIQHYTINLPDSAHQIVLMKMGPNVKALAHQHPGIELTLVLDGEFYDNGHTYRTGDLVVIDEIDEQNHHRPVAGPEGCLCLIATDMPVRFTGTLGRMLNILMRS